MHRIAGSGTCAASVQPGQWKSPPTQWFRAFGPRLTPPRRLTSAAAAPTFAPAGPTAAQPGPAFAALALAFARPRLPVAHPVNRLRASGATPSRHWGLAAATPAPPAATGGVACATARLTSGTRRIADAVVVTRVRSSGGSLSRSWRITFGTAVNSQLVNHLQVRGVAAVAASGADSRCSAW